MHTHLLINFVTKSEGIPEGATIRAIEPEEGLSAMFRREGEIRGNEWPKANGLRHLTFQLGYRWRYVK